MTQITFKRKKLIDVETYPATVLVGNSSLVGDAFYLPVTIDNYVSPSLPVTDVTAIAAQSTIKSNVVGAFDKVRIGDYITLPTGGLVLATPVGASGFGLTVITDSDIAMYPTVFDSTNLPVKAGDIIASTTPAIALPANTKVDKIDYARRLIYMSNNATETAITGIVITPRVRVVAVRPSTHPTAAAANEIELSVNVTTGSLAGGFTVVPGATEALVSTLRITPKGNNNSGVITLEVAGSKNKGIDVQSTPNGIGYTNYSAYTYLNLGNITIDADEFLLDARVPRI
jgi:hypothetical protein